MIERNQMQFDGLTIEVYSLNTVVVGSGAAGLNAACRLFREMEETGVDHASDQIALVTRGLGLGTSHNSGSDKQTYYKMGTAGETDRPTDFADTLTNGGCTHGDIALIEGQNSLQGFFRLAELGVPFPHTATGSFVGYKTDHDPKQRATSAGPRTSRFMVQKLLAELNRYRITVFNGYHLLGIVTEPSDDGTTACGLLCTKVNKQNDRHHGLVLFNCRNIIAAGGGPGELYEISVYPKGQMGPFSALFEAGAAAHNLTESQFGLASIEPRWNLSGTYQQVIPRYYSTNKAGTDEQEFLNPFFDSMATLCTDIFLKGYQWPFDHDKVANLGSSLIDILVQNEMINRGRRVFMDFRENPRATNGFDEFDINKLKPEALTYLKKSGALQATPIERLANMNQPSIDLYREMGVDLWTQPLEIGVCSQHCNGGFVVDAWWESNIRHLFVVGELAGTHGVKRPGGSALNAGQVGSMRAAQRIAHVYYQKPLPSDDFAIRAAFLVQRIAAEIDRIKAPADKAIESASAKYQIQHRMSVSAGMVRSKNGIQEALAAAENQWRTICENGFVQDSDGFLESIEVRELALTQRAFLQAIAALLARGSGSRGSHLVTDRAGSLPHPKLGEEWKFIPENIKLRQEILNITYDINRDAFESSVTTPNPRPKGEFWFENTWAEYRKASIFKRDDTDKPRPCTIYQ